MARIVYLTVGGRKHGTIVDTIEELTDIVPKGPPLPFVIACDEEVDLPQLRVMGDLLKELGQRIGLDKRRELVRAAIKKVAKLQACPHRLNVHALLTSPTVRNLIAFNWGIISPHVNDLSKGDFRIHYRFDSVHRAVVWILAGGNGNLRTWGLHQWVGLPLWKRRQIQAAPDRQKTPSPSNSDYEDCNSDGGSPVGTTSLSLSNPRTRNKGGVMATTSASNTTLPSSSRSSGFPALTSLPLAPPVQPGAEAPAVAAIFADTSLVPAPLVPHTVFKALRQPAIYILIPKIKKNAPVQGIIPPTIEFEHIYSDDDERVFEIQDTLSPSFVGIPRIARLYLQSHGWATLNPRLITIIETAYRLPRTSTTEHQVIAMLAEEGLPMTVAHFFCKLLDLDGTAKASNC